MISNIINNFLMYDIFKVYDKCHVNKQVMKKIKTLKI